jgi:hypothetical protein
MNETERKLVDALREVAAGRPDYAYEPPGDGVECLYVHNGAPSCLVGHALHRLGVPLGALYVIKPSDELIPQLFIEVGADVNVAVWNVQTAQDNGAPWGEAIMELDVLT